VTKQIHLAVEIESYHLRSTPASTARLLNCFPEILPQGAKTPLILQRTPGLASFTTVGAGPIVAMHEAFDLLYVVSGSELYEVDNQGTATLLGNVGLPGNVDIDSNTDSVVVVNEPNAYVWNTTTSTFSLINDVDFPGAGDVEFINNYLIFREPNSGRFFSADLGSATSFDALMFATAEGSPDNLVGMKVDHNEIILFGDHTAEIWADTGASGFPFERTVNGFVELGCLNGRTIAKQDNSVFWLASDFTIRRLDGVTPIRVSTHAVDQFLTSIDTTSAQAYAYSQDGHLFYVLTCSGGTWVYDVTTQHWHERGTYGQDFWLAESYAQAFDKHLVGYSTSNQIGELDPLTYDEFGGIQRMEWTYQTVYAQERRAFHDRLEIVLETGVGLTTGQGSDPEMMLSYSDDGGFTWNSAPNKKIGAIGKRRQRVIWYGLGSCEQRVYRAAVSDPIPVAVTDALLDIRGGRE
jgi:hypothetical protein